jgi:putative DNA primase/helicase
MADGGSPAADEIARSALRDVPLILSPAAPIESAREFISGGYMQDRVRTIHHQADGFHIWNGSRYAELSKEEIRSAVYKFLDGACRRGNGQTLAPFNPNRAKVANVLEALAAEAQLPLTIRAPAWLDERPRPAASSIMSCKNGLLDLPTRQALPHSPAFFTLNAVNYDYDLNAGEPAEWLRFLRALWAQNEESINTLQEMFGLLLRGVPATRRRS